MPAIDIRKDHFVIFSGSVTVGSEGAGANREALLLVVHEAAKGLLDPATDSVRLDVPDDLIEDLRSAFLVGSEGLDTEEWVQPQVEEIEVALGIERSAPRP